MFFSNTITDIDIVVKTIIFLSNAKVLGGELIMYFIFEFILSIYCINYISVFHKTNIDSINYCSLKI